MSYDIKIDGIKTHGKHGVYEFEKIENQLFLIDLHIILNKNTVVDDQIETTINYADYVEKVEELVATSSFNLIETLAKYFQCSTREIKDYLNILEKQEIDVILNEIYGYNKKKKNDKK